MNRAEYIENVRKLNYYTKKYDEGNPEISDEEWDNLYFDCIAFETESGYIDANSPSATVQYDVTNSLKKVTHNHPMLSLEKTKDINIIRKWLKHDSMVMAKMDGLTCSLAYKNGKLVSAETRGNGKIGEDITANAMTLSSIPKTIPNKNDVVIDGEVICKYNDFEEFSDSFKNPRNFAAGSIRLLDSKECAKRKLTFVAWDIISSTDNFDVKLKTLGDYGFIVVPNAVANIENLENQQTEIRQLCAKLSYPIDGLVYRIIDNSIWQSKGKNEHSFLGSFAFKCYDEEYETELIDITWSVGKSGVVTPVANFKPVIIDGTTVQNASLHNISIMKEILGNPYVGQKIWVIKANCIIPQIVKAEKVS